MIPDRALGRAKFYPVSLTDPRYPGSSHGMSAVRADSRAEAWQVAETECLAIWSDGRVLPRSVGTVRVTLGEYERLRALLGFSAYGVRHAAAGVVVRDPRPFRGGGLYVHQVMRPRCVTEVDPEVMARAGALLDKYRAQCATPSPINGKVYTTYADREARAIRCAADAEPDAFAPTGQWCAWIGPEGAAPHYASKAEADHAMRIHGHTVNALEVGGVTVATFHEGTRVNDGPGSHTWSGGPLLRVLGEHVDTLTERVAWLNARDEKREDDPRGYTQWWRDNPEVRDQTDYVRAEERPHLARLRNAAIDMASMLLPGCEVAHVAPDVLAEAYQDPRANQLAEHCAVSV